MDLRSKGESAHPRPLELRNGLARGICNRLAAGGEFSGDKIPSEIQWCPNPFLSAGG